MAMMYLAKYNIVNAQYIVFILQVCTLPNKLISELNNSIWCYVRYRTDSKLLKVYTLRTYNHL